MLINVVERYGEENSRYNTQYIHIYFKSKYIFKIKSIQAVFFSDLQSNFLCTPNHLVQSLLIPLLYIFTLHPFIGSSCGIFYCCKQSLTQLFHPSTHPHFQQAFFLNIFNVKRTRFSNCLSTTI